MGLLQPDSGEGFVDGREIETLDESELLGIRGELMGKAQTILSNQEILAHHSEVRSGTLADGSEAMQDNRQDTRKRRLRNNFEGRRCSLYKDGNWVID